MVLLDAIYMQGCMHPWAAWHSQVEIAQHPPESNLLGRALGCVGSVDDVAADLNGKVTTDGAGLRGSGVGGSDDLAAGGHHVAALPHLCRSVVVTYDYHQEVTGSTFLISERLAAGGHHVSALLHLCRFGVAHYLLPGNSNS